MIIGSESNYLQRLKAMREVIASASVDLSMSQLLALLTVAVEPNLSVNDLAERMNVPQQSASRFVAILLGRHKAASGVSLEEPLIYQEVSSSDPRKRALTLTTSGRKLIAKIINPISTYDRSCEKVYKLVEDRLVALYPLSGEQNTVFLRHEDLPRLDASTLVEIGTSFFGHVWVPPLARALARIRGHIVLPQLIYQWSNGSRKIPYWVSEALPRIGLDEANALREQADRVEAVTRTLVIRLSATDQPRLSGPHPTA